jgi:preprotein translocase subunit SecA
MIAQIIARLFGTNNARQLKKLYPIVSKINALEAQIQSLSDEELAGQTNKLREKLSQGKKLNDILPEAFATVREASKRTIGQRHYDVQLIGGIVLHQGKISEMKTGEGKTLTATLPLYLHALAGKGVHLVTVNDYLAQRDSQWMAPIYEFLGLTVSCLQHNMTDRERKNVYNSDILYATNNELGFDYLRDNMKFRKEDFVQRELNYAIVDEVDSILIDEARTPLIISGMAEQSSKLYTDVDRVVKFLKKDTHYEVDEKARNVQLTDDGNDTIEKAFNIDNLYNVEHLKLLHHVNQALRAHALFKSNVDYVVKDNQVLIVDEFTGRILAGRRYSDGLHQALEAKENVKIEHESQTLASITLQNFFRLYKTLAGMTGTAETESEEFHNIYNLDVIVVPTNRPLIRKDQPDIIFLGQNAKFQAIVNDVQERYKNGQPVLIGTVAIETSELLSNVLTASGVPHEVLNAKQHQREAEIIENAGKIGHITIATNMAGRGTDIKLTEESKQAGGLYILGTERHESRRIDNQLRGRAGRQGDQGESRFYISLEDNLIRVFAGGDSVKRRMEMIGMKEDETIESSLVSKTIERSQTNVEKQNFEYRKHLLEYDDVLNQQRIVVYQYRCDALDGHEAIYGLIRDFIGKSINRLFEKFLPKNNMEPDHVEGFIEALAQLSNLSVAELNNTLTSTSNKEQFKVDVYQFLSEKYDLLRNSTGQKEMLQQAEKWLVLETIDQAWKQHMLNLDHLKEGISLRSWGQKNPLLEYKREAFMMFKDMMEDIAQFVVQGIFHINIERFDENAIEARRQHELDQIQLSAANDDSSSQPHVTNEPKIGRNNPCPCGSGKKYKKCCG